MNMFIETYLQLRFNLMRAARSLRAPARPCTVGSVSHPSRRHCFDFSVGRRQATVPRAECSVWSRKCPPGLPARCSWGQPRRQDTDPPPGRLRDVWHVNKIWRCRKSALPLLRDRRRWGLTALPTLSENIGVISLNSKIQSLPLSWRGKKTKRKKKKPTRAVLWVGGAGKMYCTIMFKM